MKPSAVDALLAKYPVPRRKNTICFAEKTGRAPIIDELAQRGLTGSHIALILREEYAVVATPQTVTRHLRGDCQCQK